VIPSQGGKISVPNLRKPFYRVDEVLECWSMSERDIMSFVLSGALTVSASVARLRVTYGICRQSTAGVTDRILSSHRYIIGIVPLQGCDAWRVMRQGEFAITALQTPADEFAMIDNSAGHNQHVVGKSDLVISHEELICFEKANPALAGQAEAVDGNRRGAPSRYQWDDIWVELCAMIFLDGLPETQIELVQHIARWLEAQGKPVPDDSTIKKKIKPLWQRLRESMKRRAASHNA